MRSLQFLKCKAMNDIRRVMRWKSAPAILGWTIGFAATVWFLIRVIPKPSRASYPCQQAAFPLASTFVLGLVSIVQFKPNKYGKVKLSVCGLIALAVIVGLSAVEEVPTHWLPVEGANKPMGVARGIFPGRVSWVRDPAATPWNGDATKGHYWDEGTGINQAACDKMMSKCLQNLTGAATDKKAWDKIFRYYNKNANGKDVGYQTGETVALKINVNNAYASKAGQPDNNMGYADEDPQIDCDPQSTLAMLRQLINRAGVPQDKISVIEAVRVVPDKIYDPCHKEFPNVVWVDSKGNGSNGRQPPQWHKDVLGYTVKNKCGTGTPEAMLNATYIVNMSLVKGHPTCGVTLTAKNHYGSIDARDHGAYINTWSHKMGIYNPFVDLIGSKYLGGKTVLFIMDGLFACKSCNDPVDKESCGFVKMYGGEWLSSYFMSLDPVAIDSVGIDFLRSEFDERLAYSPKTDLHGDQPYGHNVDCDNYLHEAAQAGNAPSGTVYQPDGKPLASLGVHEHWNNMIDKQYSRNLSKDGAGIELLKVKD